MAIDISKINGVDKLQVNNTVIVYNFPTAVITVNTATTEITVGIRNASTAPTTTKFADLTNDFGTADAEAYADYLATNSYFFDIATVGGGDATAANQVIGNASLSSIDTKLNSQATATNQATANGYLLSLSQTITTDATQYGEKSLQVSFDPDYVTEGSELIVGQLVAQVGVKQTQSNLPLFYNRVSSGGATQTYDSANAKTVMAVSGDGQYAISQTLMRFQYNAGQTKFIELTFNAFQVVASTNKLVGYFNGGEVAPYTTYDGVFLEMDGTTYNACHAKNGTVTRIPRSLWRDKLDGSGPSGVTVDWSKFQVLRITYLWLGGTGVRFSLIVGHRLITFCQIELSNDITDVFILKPNQPLRYEIRSTGGTASLGQICAMVGSIGVNGVEGVPFAFDSPAPITLPTAGTTYMLGAIRKRAGFLAVDVKLTDFDILSTETSNDNYYYSVLLNPTIAGVVTWVSSGGAIEYAIGVPTNTVTGGYPIHRGTGSQGIVSKDSPPSVIRPGSTVAGVSDIFAICARPINNNTVLGIAANTIEFQ